MSSRTACPNGATCQWVIDATHVQEYTHPCAQGASCPSQGKPEHASIYTHPAAAPSPAPAPAPASGSSTPFTPASVASVVHAGVSCDHCHTAPISGFRFKCMFCTDTDFCSTCAVIEGVHDNSHPLIRLACTAYAGSIFQNRTGVVHHGVSCSMCGKANISGTRYVVCDTGKDVCEVCEAKGAVDVRASLIKMPVVTGAPLASGGGAGGGAGTSVTYPLDPVLVAPTMATPETAPSFDAAYPQKFPKQAHHGRHSHAMAR